jgi:CBS domain-containing protein
MAKRRTPSQRTDSAPRTAELAASAPIGSSSATSARSSERVMKESAVEETSKSSAKSSSSTAGNLKELLDELGAASEAARLQLHLLVLEARQRSGEFAARLESLERGLDRGLHQALATATDRARQLTKTLHASFGGGSSPQKPAETRVGAVMTDEVRACSPDDVLQRPAQIMWDGDCGSVPVVEASGRLCGIITDRDICMAAYTKGLSLSSIRVADVMSRSVRSCTAEDTLERAIAIMAEAAVRRLPVVAEDGKLQGIVSLADIAHGAALLGHQEAEVIVFRLLAALSKPRGSTRRPLLAAE